MKRIATIWLFAILGICLFLSTFASAEPPKKERATWKKATSISVNPQARLTASEDEDQEIVVPDVWFGGWGENEKYYLGFYAEGVDPKYQVIYGVKGGASSIKDLWDYVSLTTPQNTQVLHNPNGYEAYPSLYVQDGVYVPGAGDYYLEVRVYVTSEWYFLFKDSKTVPAFEVWLSNVCNDESGLVNVAFTLYPYFYLKFKVGDTVTVGIGEASFDVVVSSVNEYGNAEFVILVDSETYSNYQENSFPMTFTLPSGETYSHDIYFWESNGACSTPTKGGGKG